MENGVGTSSDVIEAIEKAIEYEIPILNFSGGWFDDNEFYATSDSNFFSMTSDQSQLDFIEQVEIFTKSLGKESISIVIPLSFISLIEKSSFDKTIYFLPVSMIFDRNHISHVKKRGCLMGYFAVL